MATHTVRKSVHATLSGTTADIVNLGNEWTVAEVINRAASDGAPIYVVNEAPTGTLVTAVSAADNTDIVMPGEAVLIGVGPAGLSVVGDGNDYSVVGVE